MFFVISDIKSIKILLDSECMDFITRQNGLFIKKGETHY